MKNKKVAIVLSGGGAKGAYEIGVWKALRKMHIKYDIVTGTSVGAINGLMMVQNEYHKALKLWSNIDFSFIFKKGKFTDNKENLTKNKVYLTYAKEFIKEGGMDVTNLERAITNVFNEKKFWTSPINYGLVVYNLDKLKPEYKLKKDLRPDNIISYVLASSSCYPAFKKKKIGDDKYIDGGFYDYMPINLAIEMGATDIISIDLKAPGVKQPIKDKDVNIVRIYPKNQLTSFLIFDAALSKQAIKYGYNDAMKSFGRLAGDIYSFKKNYYNTYIEKIYHSLKNNMTRKELIKTIEYLGRILEVDDTKIYKIKKYNRIVLSKFKEIDNLDYTKIKSKIRKKDVKDLLNTKYIVKYIYSELATSKEIIVLKTLFRKEYLSAIYLKKLEG